MFSFRSSSLSFALLVLLIAPKLSFAQDRSNVEDCNKPMRDPISYVTDSVPRRPMISRDGCWIITESSKGPLVFHRSGGVIQQRYVLPSVGQPRGLTHDGKTLAIANDQVTFIDLARIMSGEKDGVIGHDSDIHLSLRHAMGLVTSDNFFFLVNNDTNWVSVIDLNKVRAGLPAEAIVGGFVTGWLANATLSPDEKYLYVSSGQSGGGGQIPSPPCTRQGSPLDEREGTILIVDVQRAKSDPGAAVIAGVRAGCGGPLAVSPDGNTLYFVDRMGDALLVFDTKQGTKGGAPVLIGNVPVKGSKGLALVDNGRKLIVKSAQQLTVIDAGKIREREGAILGTIPSDEGSAQHLGMAIASPDGKTLIVEVENGLQIIDLERVPLTAPATAPASASAQKVDTAACNQPMSDPVTHINIPGITEAFPIARVAQPVLSNDGCWIFAILTRRTNGTGGNGIEVLRRNAGRLEHFRFLPIDGRGAMGQVLTHDGRTLVVHATGQLLFVDVRKLVAGDPGPVLGAIGNERLGEGQAMVVSSDDRRLFVTNGETEWISVIDLDKVRAGSFDSSVVVGGIPVQAGVRGMILSPDERYVYVAAEPPENVDWPAVCKTDPRPNKPTPHREGAIWVLDARLAASNSKDAVLAIVPAGCFAFAFALSPDGKTLYATAPLEDALLAFDIGSAETSQKPKLIGRVPVGSTPRGIVVIDGGKKIVVANTNDFVRYPFSGPLLPGEDDATVIDSSKITQGAAAVLGTIPAQAMPTSVISTADGRTLVITNMMSQTLQVVDVERLNLKPAR